MFNPALAADSTVDFKDYGPRVSFLILAVFTADDGDPTSLTVSRPQMGSLYCIQSTLPVMSGWYSGFQYFSLYCVLLIPHNRYL